jgi:branched-subunit amino acid transport protein
MTAVWITLIALAIGTFLSKAAGTLVLGGRDLSPRALNVTALVAPAILAALVAFETFSVKGGMAIDARAAGLGAALVAILAKAPMIVVILLAAAVTAGVRAFT